jgi:gamma-glutamyltranspeptidase/glutathione hydrolase
MMGEFTTSTAHAGLVATSHPLAARAGVRALEAGGTAADAAVAAAAVLCVVDPRSTGVGGDAFALHWAPGTAAPAALAGAGPAAAGLTPEALAAAGHADAMPESGAWTVTVPGAVSTWEVLLERFGRLGLSRALAEAIRLAETGFEVTPVVAREWRDAAPRVADDAATRTLLLPHGRPPAAGERWANPELAGVLREIADGGARAFYDGRAGAAIAAAVRRAGGPLDAADLAGWRGAEWVEPLSGRFRGVDIFELPPPTQGIVVLEALAIFEGLDCAGPADEEHAAIEALKLAFADARRHVADPANEHVPTRRLLDETYVAERRAAIDMAVAAPAAADRATDTVYVAAADAEGGACSFIQSLYEGFGSGIAVPGTGIVLQNRGANFVLDRGHPNRPAPGKRPYHTIIPAMLGRENRFMGCLGVVGGFMQPQGQMQILRHLLDHGMDAAAAVDAPRVRVLDGRRVGVEPGYDDALAADLVRRGHDVTPLTPFLAGGAQLIVRDEAGLHGASDPRKDGRALGC